MINLFLTASAQAGAQGGRGISMLVMMGALFIIMWFFMIRPQQKKQKEIQKFQNSLEIGTSVVTGGGIYGVVKGVDLVTGKVQLEIAKGIIITVDKAFVYKDSQSTTATK